VVPSTKTFSSPPPRTGVTRILHRALIIKSYHEGAHGYCPMHNSRNILAVIRVFSVSLCSLAKRVVNLFGMKGVIMKNLLGASGVALLLIAGVVLAGSPAAEKGDTFEQVKAKLGTPKGIIGGGKRTTYYYDRGTVEFVGGLVAKSFLLTEEEAQAKIEARNREVAEAQRAAVAERDRLAQAGKMELERTRADKAFAVKPAADRLAYWTNFAKQYPYTDVSAHIAEATETAIKEGKTLSRLVEMEGFKKRVLEIGDRLKQLDDDYAASLANWKRTEIEDERKKLNEELSSIEARVVELGN